MKRHHSVVSYVIAVAAAMLLLGMVVGGCGSTSSSTTTSGSGAPSAAASGPASMVPAQYKSSGVLKVGAEIAYPPMESLDSSGQPVGLDVDLMNGIGKILGLKIEWVNTNWDGLRPALLAHKFDVICSSLADFTDRQATLTFVDYMNIIEGALVLKANGGITTIQELAGKPVSACKGTVAVPDADKINKQLVSEGLAPMTVSVYPTDTQGMVSVGTGRIFAHIMDTVAGAYKAQTASNGQKYAVILPKLGGLDLGFPYGIAVNKDQMDLAKAIQAALTQMAADGSYHAIFVKYGVPETELQTITINGGKTASGS